MHVESTPEYQASLTPFPADALDPLGLPDEVREFLAVTGLPQGIPCEITPNAPLTFLRQPVVKHYRYLKHTYLQFASFEVMGELAVDLHFQSVHQIQLTDGGGYFPSLVNSGLSQFVDCLGAWQSFYPQFRAEIARRLDADPAFSLYRLRHAHLYDPILTRLREIDPKALRQKNFFWRRMCEPDLV